MFKNKIGMKFIGATLTAAMAVTAIPAMASLAAERDFSHLYSSYKHAYSAGPLEMVSLEQLSDRLVEVINFYYQNESKIPVGMHSRCEEVFNYVSGVIRNPDSRPDNYAIANNDLESINRTIEFYAGATTPVATEPLIAAADEEDEDEPVAPDYGMDLEEQTEDTENNEVLDAKSEALQRLQAIINEMVEFEEVFGEEMASVTDMYEYHTYIALGGSVYLTSDEYTVNGINCITERLSAKLDAVIDAIDAAEQQAAETQAEEIAPDYGMNLDEETEDEDTSTPAVDIVIPDRGPTLSEQPEDVAPDFGMDLDEDIAEEAPVTASTPAAPATRVAGASRNISSNTSIAQQVVERLYTNALNRDADKAGTAYWVNVINTNNGRVDAAITGMLNSAEFAARNLNDDEFVALLYRVILNRAPSASEVSTWTAALANGASRSAVINAFADSAEFNPTCEAHAI